VGTARLTNMNPKTIVKCMKGLPTALKALWIAKRDKILPKYDRSFVVTSIRISPRSPVTFLFLYLSRSLRSAPCTCCFAKQMNQRDKSLVPNLSLACLDFHWPFRARLPVRFFNTIVFLPGIFTACYSTLVAFAKQMDQRIQWVV
jgi:hypothetical protein